MAKLSKQLDSLLVQWTYNRNGNIPASTFLELRQPNVRGTIIAMSSDRLWFDSRPFLPFGLFSALSMQELRLNSLGERKIPKKHARTEESRKKWALKIFKQACDLQSKRLSSVAIRITP